MVYRYFKIPIYYLVLSFTYIRHSRNTDSQIIQSSNFKSKFTHPNGAFESFFCIYELFNLLRFILILKIKND